MFYLVTLCCNKATKYNIIQLHHLILESLKTYDVPRHKLVKTKYNPYLEIDRRD